LNFYTVIVAFAGQSRRCRMSQLVEVVVAVVAIGTGATAIMDVWLSVLKRAGVAGLDFAVLGRWVAGVMRGRLYQPAVAAAPPVRGERVLGWLAHYLVGIGFAGLLVAVAGPGWVAQPTLLPALALGAVTVAAPLFVMQPAMGRGFAGARTTAPAKNVLRSLANHVVFGAGLYLAAAVVVLVSR
jgi:hypothetical protein